MNNLKINKSERKRIESLFIGSLKHLLKCKYIINTHTMTFTPNPKDLIEFENKKKMYREKALNKKNVSS